MDLRASKVKKTCRSCRSRRKGQIWPIKLTPISATYRTAHLAGLEITLSCLIIPRAPAIRQIEVLAGDYWRLLGIIGACVGCGGGFKVLVTPPGLAGHLTGRNSPIARARATSADNLNRPSGLWSCKKIKHISMAQRNIRLVQYIPACGM